MNTVIQDILKEHLQNYLEDVKKTIWFNGFYRLEALYVNRELLKWLVILTYS
jgi:hypothetical protein